MARILTSDCITKKFIIGSVQFHLMFHFSTEESTLPAPGILYVVMDLMIYRAVLISNIVFKSPIKSII